MPRPRTTNEQKRIKGTDQPCRLREVASGDVISTLPVPERTGFDEVASWYYDTIGRNLISMGILEVQDLEALEDLAYSWGLYWEYEKKRIKSQDEYEKAFDVYTNDKSDDNGKYADRLLRQLKHFEQEKNKVKKLIKPIMASFGLSPVDRQKLEIKKRIDVDDPIRKLLAG